jgi:type IV pilus assembly protein PilV
MKLISKNSRGFFTLEAIVAVMIFMIGIVGALQIQTTAIRANSDAQYRINASYFAEEIIADMSVNIPNIPTYADGSNTWYQKWVVELTKSIPGVSNNPPIITATANGSAYNVTVTIFWKKPGDSVVSQFKTTTVIF